MPRETSTVAAAAARTARHCSDARKCDGKNTYRSARTADLDRSGKRTGNRPTPCYAESLLILNGSAGSRSTRELAVVYRFTLTNP